MARLIVVSGPNGAGKTTLIKSAEQELLQLGYHIIIPDELELISNSDTPISDAIAVGLENNLNVVFETPLQFDELTAHVEKFSKEGYNVVLIQLFLENTDKSVLRVKDRLKKGGRNILPKDVKMNFEGNYKNIIKYRGLFNQIYFIDASNKTNPIVAELQYDALKYFMPIQSIYIHDVLYEMTFSNNESRKALKANKAFGQLSHKRMTKAERLIFKLKR